MTGEALVGWLLVVVALVAGWFASPPADGLTLLAIAAAVFGVLLITDARTPNE